MPGTLNLSKGFLVWWSIPGGVFDLGSLRLQAMNCKLPKYFRDKLSGAEGMRAWDRATFLTPQGIESKDSDADIVARYVIKNVKKGERLLVRERISQNNKVLGIHQLGLLSYENSFKFTPYGDFEQFKDEVQPIVDSMGTNFGHRLGNVDDQQLRVLLYEWVERRHRTIVRTDGGVYYLPHAIVEGELETEILNINQWLFLHKAGGITSIEIFDSEATTIKSIIGNASAEISSQIEEVDGKILRLITTYKEQIANGVTGRDLACKVGSYQHTMESYQKILEELNVKLQLTQNSLGDHLGEMDTHITMLQQRTNKAMEVFNLKANDYNRSVGKPAKKPTQTMKRRKV